MRVAWDLLYSWLAKITHCYARNSENRHKRWDPITSYFHPINSPMFCIPFRFLTFRALAVEGVDLVDTLAIV